MGWIFASLIMFVSSVWTYLFIRKSSLNGNPVQYNFLSAILISFATIFFIGIISGEKFTVSLWQFVWILLAVIFSYLGNRTSFKSIELAPNPGYSLIVTKSYVVLTTLFSVILFNASLNWLKVASIIWILIFSSLIVVSGKKQKNASNNLWLILAFVSFFCWTFLALVSKYLFDLGLSVYTFLSYLLFFVLFLILFEKDKRNTFRIIKKDPWIFLSIGLGASIFNLSMFTAYKIAPNLGYVDAINTASISALTIASVIFFKDELTVRKFIGILGISAGVAILVLS